MKRVHRIAAWAAVVLVTVAIAAFWPFRLTDGDSCVYAAMAHDMAQGGSWIAPTWDFHGAVGCFHDHAPGAFWLAAIVERLGAPWTTAALVANALWTFAAVAGVVALARLFVSKATADFAGLAFLLHSVVMRYAQRAGLEIPFAATAAWTLAAGLRLGRSRWWIVATGAALAGAFLVRDVMAIVPAALLVYAAIDKPLRPPIGRLVAASALAAAALFAFDRAHAAATGHGFWSAYVEREIFPSLEGGGSRHAVDRETWPYYVESIAIYSLPWSLFPVWRLWRGPRPVPSPAAWRLAAAWIVFAFALASTSSREGSRYVSQVDVATALLAALAVGPELKPTPAWFASTFVMLVLPAVVLLKTTAFHDRGTWWDAARRLDELHGDPRLVGREIHGVFKTEDDRMKTFLRFHTGAWVSSAPVPEMKGLQWIAGAGADFPAGRVIVATPLGALVDFDAR
jgi:4-amino-4-deoxy-L-arabinose transferase-like glycosyltransferase